MKILLLLIALAAYANGTESKTKFRYCVIGAGPGGVQIAYLLQQAGLEYVVFEKEDVPGNFFKFYPKHDYLLSINKQYFEDQNQHMRYDWHSFLTNDSSLLFSSFSDKYYPHREELFTYINHFARKTNLNILFKTKILKVRKARGKNMQSFVLETENQRFACKVLILATGVSVPKKPDKNIPGLKYAIGYENIPPDVEFFRNKSVLILGRGNSGMEVAKSIYDKTAYMHVLGRFRTIRLATSTHYPADISSSNNLLVDTYQLKSLDAIVEGELQHDYVKVRLTKSKSNQILVKLNPPLHERNDFPLREAYDVVIRCLGFQWDDSIFTLSTNPGTSDIGEERFPMIFANFEAKSVSGLFITGSLAHSIDFRLGAGGFIAGFRYYAQTLFNLLNWRYEGKKWPSYGSHLYSDSLVKRILKRLRESAALFLLPESLVDVVIINKNHYTYLEELPLKLLPYVGNFTGHWINRSCEDCSMLVISFKYGTKPIKIPFEDVWAPTKDPTHYPNETSALHPVVYLINSTILLKTLFKPAKNVIFDDLIQSTHHIVPDYLYQFDNFQLHIQPLSNFLKVAFNRDSRPFSRSACSFFSVMRYSCSANYSGPVC